MLRRFKHKVTMTFPLINYDGNKGEHTDDGAWLKPINHPHAGDRTQLQK